MCILLSSTCWSWCLLWLLESLKLNNCLLVVLVVVLIDKTHNFCWFDHFAVNTLEQAVTQVIFAANRPLQVMQLLCGQILDQFLVNITDISSVVFYSTSFIRVRPVVVACYWLMLYLAHRWRAKPMLALVDQVLRWLLICKVSVALEQRVVFDALTIDWVVWEVLATESANQIKFL